MSTLTLEQKRQRIRKITASDSALMRIIDMTKPNDAPAYNGAEMLRKSKETVGARGGKYASVARGFAEGKKFSRK